jgi:hypothetical protein
MTESTQPQADRHEIRAALKKAHDWSSTSVALAALRDACGRDRENTSLWHELTTDCERPIDASVFSLEDSVWRACLDQVAERLHPQAGRAAQIVVAVVAATDGYPERLRSLEIADPELDDIVPLATLTGLQAITIDQSEDMPGSLCDLSPLASLNDLSMVNLTCGAEDLSPLARLPKLRELLLVYCDNVADLGPLAQCKSLEELCIDGCEGIQDVSALAKCKSLKKLTLSALSNVEDLGPLSGFQGDLELEGMEHVDEGE